MRYFFIVFVTFLLIQPVNAITKEKTSTFGGSNPDYMRSAVALDDGGFLAVGDSSSNNGDMSNHKGAGDLILFRFDSDGNKKWVKNYGGSGTEYAGSVVLTPSNEYIVIGYSNSSNGDFSFNRGDYDAYIGKFDSLGNKIWMKKFGGTKRDEFSSISVLSDGSYIVTGLSQSPDGDFPNSKGNYDSFIVKLDSNGTILWKKNVGGSGSDFLYSNIVLQDGSIYVAGYSDSTDGDINATKGNYDGVIMKYDSFGNRIWTKTYGGSGNDSIGKFIVNGEGDFIAFGSTLSTNGDFPVVSSLTDAFIFKTDNNGNLIWSKIYGGNNHDSFTDATLLGNGHFIATGYTYSTVFPGLTLKGGTDGLYGIFDSKGNPIVMDTIGGSSDEILYSSTILSDNRMALFGYTRSSNGDILVNRGYADFLIGILSPLDFYRSYINLRIQGGSLSLSHVPSIIEFGNLDIDSKQHNIDMSLSAITIEDNRGTLEGWNLSVSATPFVSTTDENVILGAESFLFNGIQSLNQVIGNTSLPVINATNPVSIDTGNVKILSSANGSGAGTFDITFPTNSLSLFVDISKPLNINGPTTFESSITWTLSSGP